MKNPLSKLATVAAIAGLLLAGPALAADRDDRFGHKGPERKLSHAAGPAYRENRGHDRGRGHHDRGRGHHDKGRRHHDKDRRHHDKDRRHHDKDRRHHDKDRRHHDKGRRHHDRDWGRRDRDWGHRDRRHHYGDRHHYKHGYRHRHHWRPRHYGYGYRWNRLPRNFVRISFGGLGFYYSDGIFYRPHQHGYVVAQPPVGAIVYSLPASAVTLAFGGHNYYVAYDTYYLWDGRHRGYRVVRNPGFY
ncbi:MULTISPECIES: DUF6515 family protein [unclassified Microbulbifer]|uniref:DUF6515 family protein n=1 Tax=unclassified Microbulbifer TaxID=2619833 RepID=UPI0027E47F93|nr:MULTISPECIES: DUF6515 family protein [unclassified Microbulbifer]